MEKGVRRDRQLRMGNMARVLGAWLVLFLAPLPAVSCGLDWTLPQAHFEGVEEHGFVSYWEKIGEIDLGDKVVLPVNIGFNSHREGASPVLGKGWIVALLESHVEPIDENAMNVVMPDGWTFLFLRNANSETWRGNAGWMGETNDARFTISAPCGWKIIYDHGKIQEIDGDQNGALTFCYNGGVPVEIDHNGTAILQVERDPASGMTSALVIAGRRVELSLAQRPRVVNLLGKNLINGFDPSLASMQQADGGKETFAFGTDQALNPTLTLNGPGQLPRTFVWDATTRQIKSDGAWTYALKQSGDHLRFTRTSAQNQIESYETDESTGVTSEKSADGAEVATYRFVSGPLTGCVRKIEQLDGAGRRTPLYSASYYPSGLLMREMFYPDVMKSYSEKNQLLKETVAGQVVYEQDLDSEGRVTHVVDTAKDLEIKMSYESGGGRTTQVFQKGALFYTEQIDGNNKLVSLNEGEQ
jgi:hypothetical protein